MTSPASNRPPEENIRDAFDLARRMADHPGDYSERFVVPLDPDTT